jgi:hypothetical protein
MTPEGLRGLLQSSIFDFRSDPATGLVRTSGVSDDENREMGARQWVTDTVRFGDLQRRKDPAGWRRAVLTLARFYTQPTERAAAERAIADPRTYREGGPHEGVAHIFDPRTLARDPAWHNNGRLESHGLALSALATVDDPLAREAAALLVRYLEAIDYASAPSVGPWEETKFAGSLTWDTEAVRAGLAAVGRPSESGRQRVLEGVRALRESDERPLDAATVFVSSSAGAPGSIEEHLRLLETLEHGLLRPLGMIRYVGDAYLSKDYWTRLQAFGSKDASDPAVFAARAAQAVADTEAQWFMVSDLSRGWGVQVARLLDGGGDPALVEHGLRKEAELLERAWARVTPDGVVKSNGQPCPGGAVPEAYEAVSASDGGTRYVPGVNTPLAWAAASLYAASRQLLSNLETHERH